MTQERQELRQFPEEAFGEDAPLALMDIRERLLEGFIREEHEKIAAHLGDEGYSDWLKEKLAEDEVLKDASGELNHQASGEEVHDGDFVLVQISEKARRIISERTGREVPKHRVGYASVRVIRPGKEWVSKTPERQGIVGIHLRQDSYNDYQTYVPDDEMRIWRIASRQEAYSFQKLLKSTLIQSLIQHRGVVANVATDLHVSLALIDSRIQAYGLLEWLHELRLRLELQVLN